jgi:hypothetical protein
MNCADVSRILAEHRENRVLPPALWEHASQCRSCQKLLQPLDLSAGTEDPSAMIRHIQQQLIRDLRPVRPLLSARFLLILFLTAFVVVVSAATASLGAWGIAVRSFAQLLVIMGTMVAGAGWLGCSLARQMVPGGSRERPLLLPGSILVVLLVEVLLLFHAREESHFWAHSRLCLAIGLLLAGITAFPLWIILRRGVILYPQVAGATTGLLAGLVGLTVLELHCPNVNLWHIFAAHLGAAAFCSLIGLLLGTLQEFWNHGTTHV